MENLMESPMESLWKVLWKARCNYAKPYGKLSITHHHYLKINRAFLFALSSLPQSFTQLRRPYHSPYHNLPTVLTTRFTTAAFKSVYQVSHRSHRVTITNATLLRYFIFFEKNLLK